MDRFYGIGIYHARSLNPERLQLEDFSIRGNIETRPQVLQRADNPFVRIGFDRIMKIDPGHMVF